MQIKPPLPTSDREDMYTTESIEKKRPIIWLPLIVDLRIEEALKRILSSISQMILIDHRRLFKDVTPKHIDFCIVSTAWIERYLTENILELCKQFKDMKVVYLHQPTISNSRDIAFRELNVALEIPLWENTIRNKLLFNFVKNL